MIAKNCMKIKDLEKRLTCLEDRFQILTDQLANERDNGMISDEVGNLPHILVERAFVQEQIRIIRRRIQLREQLNNQNVQNNPGLVHLGSQVRLQNGSADLEIQLVSHENANPSEGFISEDSPIGQAILGKSRGEKVQVNIPSGSTHYIIREIL
jgi:transcription elongation GreA/GreB family factor